jgi:hypothetical protein
MHYTWSIRVMCTIMKLLNNSWGILKCLKSAEKKDICFNIIFIVEIYSSSINIQYIHCQKIYNLFVWALERGRTRWTVSISSLMIPQHICSMCIKIKTNQVGKQEVGIWWVQKRFPRYGVPIWSLWPNIRFLPSIVAEKNVTKNVHTCSMCIKTN